MTRLVNTVTPPGDRMWRSMTPTLGRSGIGALARHRRDRGPPATSKTSPPPHPGEVAFEPLSLRLALAGIDARTGDGEGTPPKAATYHSGHWGHRLARNSSTPQVRPAAPISSASAIAASAASLLEGVQNHAPLANM